MTVCKYAQVICKHWSQFDPSWVNINFCCHPQAARYNVHYPQYHLMILGWYSEQWWIDPSTDYDLHDCTVEDREEVLLYTFGVWEFDLITEFNKTTDTGLVSFRYLYAWWLMALAIGFCVRYYGGS